MKRVALVALLALAACGEAGLGKDPSPTPVQLTVWNRSQFELLDVRVHRGTVYAGAPNLLAEPLPIEAQVTIDADTASYVTVIRRKVEVGDTIALTTARQLEDAQDGSVLVVFDEAFRLMPAAVE